jgi:hypothetical protein
MLGHGHTDRTYMTSIQGFRFILSHVCSVGIQEISVIVKKIRLQIPTDLHVSRQPE